MGRQTFRDESNYKHESHAKHNLDDEFKKGTITRNWQKNLKSETEEEVEEDLSDSESDEDFEDAHDDRPYS